MGQFAFKILSFRRDGDVIHLEAEKNGRAFSRTVTASKLVDDAGRPDPLKIARWMMHQRIEEPPSVPDWRQAYTVTTHTRMVDGEPVEDVATVAAEPLRRDGAARSLRALPGWAEWTAGQAAAWIEANVTDLASAKRALAAMARMLVYLRDMADDEEERA